MINEESILQLDDWNEEAVLCDREMIFIINVLNKSFCSRGVTEWPSFLNLNRHGVFSNISPRNFSSKSK